MLNDDDLNRYARQVIIPNFEEEGQKRLLNTKCLVVGAGGLGCPVALYASAAGFGHIKIYDQDVIEISNLNRQIAHKIDHIGNNKAENLVQECKKINPKISIVSEEKYFDETVDISDFDLIFDCSDNPKTKYILNYLAHKCKKLLISGSAVQMEGQFAIWKSGQDINCPCYECVFPRTDKKAPTTNCREAGIIGPVTGLIGSMQVNEAIKEIALKDYQSTAGNLFLYDGLTLNLDKIALVKNLQCPVCSK